MSNHDSDSEEREGLLDEPTLHPRNETRNNKDDPNIFCCLSGKYTKCIILTSGLLVIFSLIFGMY